MHLKLASFAIAVVCFAASRSRQSCASAILLGASATPWHPTVLTPTNKNMVLTKSCVSCGKSGLLMNGVHCFVCNNQALIYTASS